MNTHNFIIKAIAIHGNMYSYNNAVYTNSRTKLFITCKIHGDFLQRADSHLAGQTCRTCSDNKQSKFKLSTLASFITKAEKIHGNKYDYSNSSYKSCNIPIDILCKQHGLFSQKPTNHLSGKGCGECGRKSKNRYLSQEEFISRAKCIHLDKYDYSNVKYTYLKNKIEIICKQHGAFQQVAGTHVGQQKSGCPKCGKEISGFRKEHFKRRCKNDKGIFYILQCYKNKETFYKIDITSTSVKRRYSSKSDTPFNYLIVYEYGDLSERIYNLEHFILNLYKSYRLQTNEKFKGYTECFNHHLPVEEIVQLLNNRSL